MSAVRTERPLRLRRMTAADLDAVVALQRTSFAHPWNADMLRRELDHEWSVVLVAEEAAPGGAPRVVGFIVFWLVHDELHVLNVATLPEARRRGIGRTLMLEAEALGLRRRAVLSTLEVRRSNEGAIALYKGLGYRLTGVRPRYYAEDGEDALVMIKDLARG